MRPVCSPTSNTSPSGPSAESGTSPLSTAASRPAYSPRASSFGAAAANAVTSSRSSSCSSGLRVRGMGFSAWRGTSPRATAARMRRLLLVRVGFSQDSFEFVLEAAGLDGAVHAALLGRVDFPPPAPAARIGAQGDRSGARRAGDRAVALGVERVHGHVVRLDVVLHLFFGPVGQRVDLHQPAVVVVDLHLTDVGAAGPLIAAQPG